MEWLDCMNKAIGYLEVNMEGKVDVEEAAHIALSSRFHFQRMFYMLCGTTIAGYVRNRRLTLAAQELAIGGCKVIDVALKYGYETPESFAKAFSKFHGISPSAARKPGVRLKSVSRLTFVISVKGEQKMEYKLVKKDAFRIVGKVLTVPMEDAGHSKTIPQFWTDCMNDGMYDTLLAAGDSHDTLGLCANFDPDMKSFEYIIAVMSKSGAVPPSCMEMTVKPLTWAVFETRGQLPTSIQDLNIRVFSEWFPSSGFEHDDGPEVEFYPDEPNGDDYRCEVWVPVK